MKYKGKEPCQGCGKPGSDVHRESKDTLCDKCGDEIRLGRLKDVESRIKYMLVFQHYHAYPGDILNDIVHNFLKAVHNENAETGGVNYIRQAFGSNGKYYNIDSRFYEPLVSMMDALENECKRVRDLEESIPSKIQKQIKKERDKIYNEGIEQGRNLLIQLNNGTLTLDQLESKKEYKS